MISTPVVKRCGWGLLALGGNPSRSFAGSLHKHLAVQGNSLVLADSPPRSLQLSKQNLRKGRWSSSAVASKVILKKRYMLAKIRKRRNQKKIPTPKTEMGKN